jgi:hypothetical protein
MKAKKSKTLKMQEKNFYTVIRTYRIVDSRSKTEQVFMKDKSRL